MSSNYGNVLDRMNNIFLLDGISYKNIGRVRVSHIPATKEAKFINMVYSMVVDYEVDRRYKIEIMRKRKRRRWLIFHV